jgi:hypothetical protein
MSIIFLQSTAKARLKVEVPALASMDATIFNARFTDALNISIAELWDELLSALDPFPIDTTITGVAPTTGAVKINTTLGDAYVSALVTGAQKVFGDTIWIYNATTAKFFKVPRVTLDEIVIGGTGETVEGFLETNGNILIYLKEATMTTIPADLAYNYVRDPVMPAVDGDPLPIPQDAFGTLMSKLAAYFVQ